MRYLAVMAALAGVLVICAGFTDEAFDRVTVLRVKDRALITFPLMMREVRRSKVIIVGEGHERPFDHLLALKIMEKLRKQGVPFAVALEMFSADRQQALDDWVAGRLGVDEFISIYNEEWRIPWANYREIFLYARREKIPLVGINAPAGIAAKVSRQGFSALTREERNRLPVGVACNVDPRYRGFIARAYRQHDIRIKSFRYFCEAQMLWNKVMAWHLAGYLQRFPARDVLVIAGTGHAMKQGIPAELDGYVTVQVSVIMADSPAFPLREMTHGDTDYVVIP
jgi:uncharacterized iron-regulated protein